MKSLRLRSLLAFVFVMGSFGFADGRLVSVDVRIDLKAGTANEKTASALASGIGRVVKMTGSGVVIRLNSPDRLEDQIQALEARKSVAKVEALAPMLPGERLLDRPFSELKQIVAEYRESYLEWAEATGVEVEGEEGEEGEVPGLGYLEAYLQWKHDRAFPNEFVDVSGYENVARQRTFANQLTQNPQGMTVREAYGAASRLGFKNALKGGLGGSQEDVTGQWEFMGPRDLRAPYRIYFGLSPVNGRANAVAFDPVDSTNTFYTGGAMGGVWKTTDGGVTWNTTTDGWPLLGVSSLAVHPTNSNIVLAGTGDFYGSDVAGMGVMRSADAGQTWTRTGLNMGSSMIPGLVFYPDNPNVVFAVAGRAGGSTRGVYRSTDAGQNWSEVVTTDTDWSYVDVGAQRGNGTRTIWAVAGGTSAIRTSVDQGVTWTTITPPVTGTVNPLHIAASKINPDTAYLLSTTGRKVWKTVDAGATWTDVTAGFPNGTSSNATYNWSQGWYDYYIKTSAVNGQDMVYVGLIDVVLSVNGGATWRSIGGTNFTAAYTGSAIVHQDNHNGAVDPNNPTRALISTDGGVFVFNYNAASDSYTWDRLNKTLGITQFYTLAVHPTNPDYVTGGTQDNATPHSFNNLVQWQNPGAGDGAGCAINPLNTNIQYNSSQNHGLTRTTNAWSSSSGFKPSFGSDSVPFIGKIWLDPNDPTNVYVNTNYLWRYKEGTGTWTARLGGQLLAKSGQVRAVAIAKGDSNIIYTGASNGDLYMSRDFGSTWKQLDSLIGFTNRSILDISVNPNNTDDILVAVGGSGDHLYRVTNTNAANPTLTSVSGGSGLALPNVAANTIARDPWQPETRWYIGTDVGVFTTDNGGLTYTDITQPLGLPNVQVSELIANPTTGYLTGATFGRGIWRMKMIPAQIQSVVATPNSVMSGDGGLLTVSIDRQAPTGGVTVPLASSSTNLVVPSSVFIPAGSSSVEVAFTTAEIGSTETVFVSATLGSSTVTAEVAVLGTVNRPILKFAIKNSENVLGTAAGLLNSDDSYVSWDIKTPGDRVSLFTGITTIPVGNPLQSRLEFEVRANVPDLLYQLLAYNLATNTFDILGSGTLSTSDQVVSGAILDMSKYTGPSVEPRFALLVRSANGQPYTVFVDRARVRIVP